jgi:hypothetical protein
MSQGSASLRIIAALLIPAVICCCGVRQTMTYFDERSERRKANQDYLNAPAPEVVLGTPTAPSAKLAPPAYPPDELADASAWPRACTLLTADDIRVFLPQADSFVFEGEAETMRFQTKEYQRGLDGGLRPPVITAERRIDVPEQRCAIKFWLPYKSRLGHRNPIAGMEVEVEGAGDPEVVWAYAFTGYLGMSIEEADFAKANGARGCAGLTLGTTFSCTKGPLTVGVGVFWLNGMAGDVQQLRMPSQPVLAEDHSRRFQEALARPVMAYLLAKIT